VLNPSVIDLLVGVADGLQAEVLDTIEAGPARDQVAAAVAIVRRVARALPGVTPYVLADLADVGAVLADLTGEPTAPLPDPATVGLDELFALARDRRATLASLIDERGLDERSDAVVRAALARLTERDASLRLSPWER
jgi:hypothetical protein